MRAGPKTSDEGQNRKPQWTNTRFKVPAKLNLDDVDYFDMIDGSLPISELPVIKAMTDAEPKDFIMMEVMPIVSFPKFLCHAQAVERRVKLVTEEMKAVYGQKSPDGFIMHGWLLDANEKFLDET